MESKYIVKHLVDQLLQYQDKIIQLMAKGVEINLEEKSDDSTLIFFDEVRKNSLFINSAVSGRVADSCQLLNQEDNFEDVSLDQIKTIYEGNVRIHPLDLDAYESLAFYLNSILDQPEQAKLVLSSGIERIERKILELKIALSEFE